MKTKLLALCFAFPFFLRAQNIVEETAKENQLIPDIENPQVPLRAGASELPDSVYTYHDSEYEHLYQKAAFIYDDQGRVVQEKGLKNIDGEENIGILYRKDYTYMIESEHINKEEVVESYFNDNKWNEVSKNVTYSRSDNPTSTKMIIGTMEYSKATNKWELEQCRTTTEFDEKGYPVVMIDSLWQVEGLVLRKFEISYTESAQIDSIMIYRPDRTDEDKWQLSLKSGYTYDADGKLTNINGPFFSNLGSFRWFEETKYAYDEKGNLISKISITDIKIGLYYKNFYSSTVSNQALDPVKLSNVYMDRAGYMVVDIAGVENATVYLCNTSGQVLLKQTVSLPKTTIPVSNLAKGVCIVKVETAKGSETFKVLVK